MVAEHLTNVVVERAVESAAAWPSGEGRARQCLLDWIGVVLASHDVPGSSVEFGETGSGAATVLISGRRAVASEAALLNAMHAHLLDFDDFHLDVPGHASAPVIGAALAVAEASEANLDVLLRAIVVGIEATTTLGRLAGAALFERGWHPTAVLGAIGSAVAAATVLEHQATQLRNSVALAALQASGSMAGFGSIGKPWQVGCAARNGVQAARAAATLADPLPEYLSGRFGVLSLMAGEASGDGSLPAGPSIQDTQFKYYSTCFGTHAAIDATRALIDEADIQADEVERIDVQVGPSFEHVVINPAPTTGLAAKFSVSALLALTLIGRPPVVPDFFEPELAASPQYQRLEHAVRATGSRDIHGGGAAVRLVLRDGRVLERHQEESAPETIEGAWTRLGEKVVANVTPVIGPARALELVDLVRDGSGTVPARSIAEVTTGERFDEEIGAPQ